MQVAGFHDRAVVGLNEGPVQDGRLVVAVVDAAAVLEQEPGSGEKGLHQVG